MTKVFAGAVTAILAMAGVGSATTASFWNVHTQAGFAAGELTDVAVNSDGAVMLAPPLERLEDTEELYIWSMVRDATGSLFVGTGNNGKIFKLTPKGLRLHADLEEPDVLSLAIGADGKRLFAGTSGGGMVYEVDASGAGFTAFYDTQEGYVWDLAIGDDGHLFAGTGDGGRIHRIDDQGHGTLFFDSPETHIMSLLPGADGELYAGGEGKGLVYKLSASGDPFVLHELDEPEVCCLVLDADRSLYVAGISVPGTGPRGGVPLPAAAMRMPPETAMEPSVQAQGSIQLQNGNPSAPTPGAPMEQRRPSSGGGSDANSAGSSTVYRIDADGVVTAIWHSAKDVVHALALADSPELLDANGALVAGTGQRGRLYRIDPEAQTWAVTAEVSESQVTAIDVGESQTLLGGANMGALFSMGQGHAAVGTLESIAFDASTWSAWGRLSWKAKTPRGTAIAFQTRAGNSSEPDSSWSPWSEVRVDDAGGNIDSPNARFVQWRAELTSSKPSETPTLKRVSLAYMQRNLKPQVHFIGVVPPSSSRENRRPGDPAKAETRASGPPPLHSDDPVRGPSMVTWQASDGNADRLRYDLYFRLFDAEEGASWTVLEEGLDSESHRWETASFPDGLYELRVVASDKRSNSPEVALSGERISEPVLIDNTAPEIRGLKFKSGDEGILHVSGTARDVTGPITQGYYRVDAGDWVPISAADGLFDSAQESFSFEVQLHGDGRHAVVVRIIDVTGNAVSERVLH